VLDNHNRISLLFLTSVGGGGCMCRSNIQYFNLALANLPGKILLTDNDKDTVHHLRMDGVCVCVCVCECGGPVRV